MAPPTSAVSSPRSLTTADGGQASPRPLTDDTSLPDIMRQWRTDWSSPPTVPRPLAQTRPAPQSSHGSHASTSLSSDDVLDLDYEYSNGLEVDEMSSPSSDPSTPSNIDESPNRIDLLDYSPQVVNGYVHAHRDPQQLGRVEQIAAAHRLPRLHTGASHSFPPISRPVSWQWAHGGAEASERDR